MHWIAPSAKDTAAVTLEKRPGDTADQFRANSGLKAREYSGPILGIMFRRFAGFRFTARRAKLECPSPVASRHPLPSDGRGAGGEGGRFDFVFANPPFNVNAVDKKRLKDTVEFDGTGQRKRACRRDTVPRAL